MRSLMYSAIQVDPDLEIKQMTAQQQMTEIITRLQIAPKYHTLTQQDRVRLKKEGYASELVDHLVVMTQRQGNPTSSDNDELLIGFTYAAFDPALFASPLIKNHFEQLSFGCCSLCESFLMDTACGNMSHYRPVQLLDSVANEQIKSQCSPYYALAYQQDNLLYVCPACDEKHKAGLFPVKEKRYPDIPLVQEQPLLINPYQEQPRDYIRFNPQNGQAFAYDTVCAFYLDRQGLTPEQVEKRLWQRPNAIPHQFDVEDELLTDPRVEQDYQAWLDNQPQPVQLSRGQTTIDVLGLNRTALVVSRLATLRQLSADRANDMPSPPLTTDEVESNAYRSLALDALSTWYWQQKNTPNPEQKETPTKPSKRSVPCHNKITNTVYLFEFPVWLRSSLVYIVTESELDVEGHRRLVCLSAKDRLYGEKPKEKCVFLPINWQRDKNNIVKVRSHRNIWEASFSEFATSRPQELVDLFANNDVWVEGHYPALRETANLH